MAFAGKDTAPEKHTGFTFRGREIILSKTRGAPFKGLKAMGLDKGIYPEEKRIEAVTLYAATGHFGQTSELCGVPEHTIRAWRKMEWFHDLLREIRGENNEKLDSKFTEIVERSLDQIVDRVENGDFALTRDGELVRKPMSGKDLSLVAAINVDKRQLLRGEPTSRSATADGELSVAGKAVERLERLATTFEGLAKHGRVPKVIDAQDAELITDARSGGADEATQTGYPENKV